MNNWITPNWPATSNIQAFFTTRQGGFSRDLYAGFNLGDHVGDNPLLVQKNRAELRNTLPGEPRWLKQVHGKTLVWVDKDNRILPEADAALSCHPGVICAVLTADCLPVFLCNDAGTIVSVVHAGWRGLAAGIIERTVTEMDSNGIMAYLGPAIGPNYFEVGEEVREIFIQHDKRSAVAFTPHHKEKKGKWFANIFLLAQQRLTEIGITKIYSSYECTVSDPTRFFSHRRDGNTGRMAGLIWITN